MPSYLSSAFGDNFNRFINWHFTIFALKNHCITNKEIICTTNLFLLT